MVLLNKKGTLLEFVECGLNHLDKVLEQFGEQDQWQQDFLTGLYGKTTVEKNTRGAAWMMNKKLVGYTSLEGAATEKLNGLKFYLAESEGPTEEICEYFIKASANLSFNRLFLDSLLFRAKEHCDIVSNLFIKVFRPHAVGWVHLDDQKYILTRNQFLQTEKEFYWT